jgi:hypothetical protein
MPLYALTARGLARADGAQIIEEQRLAVCSRSTIEEVKQSSAWGGWLTKKKSGNLPLFQKKKSMCFKAFQHETKILHYIEDIPSILHETPRSLPKLCFHFLFSCRSVQMQQHLWTNWGQVNTKNTGPPVKWLLRPYFGCVVRVSDCTSSWSASGFDDALQRRPPLSCRALELRLLLRQLMADEQSNQKTEEPLHVAMCLKNLERKRKIC